MENGQNQTAIFSQNDKAYFTNTGGSDIRVIVLDAYPEDDWYVVEVTDPSSTHYPMRTVLNTTGEYLTKRA